MNLGAHHEQAAVLGGFRAVRVQRFPKTRPTGTGVVLGAGAEQWRTAARAGVGALRFVIVILPGERAFGCLLPANLVLL